MPREFKPGDRVRITGHWEFEDGITGTIREPDRFIVELCGKHEWSGCRRRFHSRKGLVVTYWVEFDEPHDDGSGDGPYGSAEIDADSLGLLRESDRG